MIKKIHLVFLVKKYLIAVVLTIVVAIFSSSCKIYQPAYYFKDIKSDTIISGFVNNNLELKIQRNDVLTISISSLNTAEDQLFNKAVTASIEAKSSGFQVSPDGNIYLHKLGKIAAEGLTRKELKAKLENELLPYLKDPILVWCKVQTNANYFPP